ncbi:MAG: MBOAT family protein [Clostridia bacterium]|nr:MBOAT family protein [Clostridia bacterium]
MVFSSLTFLFVFLPITAALYFLPSVLLRPQHTGRASSKVFSCRLMTYKNAVLLIMSLFFYAWGEPVNVVLMLLSIIFNFCIGADMQRKSGKPNVKKLLFALSLLFNLGTLGFFKYSGFIVNNINLIPGMNIRFIAPGLPVGISFYTFQVLSYVIDVYREKVSPQENILDFGLYISMFPQLIAGPIVQYSTIEKQLRERRETGEGAMQGIWLFTLGLAKKALLANSAGAVYTSLTGQGFSLSALSAWTAVLFYTFQIYFDFSGYSDMARGLGKIFGFDFPENFSHPYIADSITDFWRRWHISLSSWFRDYVYIPLGGSRCSPARNIFNLFAVWFLTGLWHGASWSFVLWGLYYLLLLVLEKHIFSAVRKKLPVALRRALTFVLVMLGWVLFSCESLSGAGRMFASMFGANGLTDSTALYTVMSNAAILVIMGIFSTPLFSYELHTKRKSTRAVMLLLSTALFVLSVICIISDSYNPFLYFRF